MKNLIVAAFLAVLLVVVSGDEHHKRCCGTCKTNYPNGHHLKHSCLHGCRLYSMIYLAHDKSIANNELSTMCSKSCKKGFTGGPVSDDIDKACNVGCQEQARVFQEHGMSDHGAKMSVMHGMGMMPPMMHSSEPFHHRIFQQMRAMHARMMEAMKNAKHAVIQRIQIRIHSLPPGPDGKPRYQVEIHQHRFPMAFGRPVFGNNNSNKDTNKDNKDQKPPKHLLGGDDHDMMHHSMNNEMHHGMNNEMHHSMNNEMHHGMNNEMHHGMHNGMHHGMNGPHHPEHHGHHRGHSGPMYRVRHFFSDMSEPAKTCLRWSLFALLLVSVLCLGWLTCRACRRMAAAAAQRQQHQRLSITKALVKKKPCVQSGDIFYVDVGDKKPLIEDDVLDKKDEA